MQRKSLSNPLLYFVAERESIRLKRASGEKPPWTDDPILRQYRFTNVRRKHDRVSQWIIEHVLSPGLQYNWFSPNTLDPLDVFLKWSALCRWVNWPPTLGRLLKDGYVGRGKIDLVDIGYTIDQIVDLDEKAWTGAYMIRPAKPPYTPMGKGLFISTIVVGKELTGVLDHVKLALSAKSVQATCEALQRAEFWGPFMAGQVVADWSYTPLLADAADLYTWAPQGPGSRRGYNRLLGRPLTSSIPEDEWCGQLQEWREDIIRELGSEYQDMTLGDLQNCLCETDKMLRVKYGEGRPRATFTSAEGLF